MGFPKNCKICASPHRKDIDLLIKKGYRYIEAARLYFRDFNKEYLHIEGLALGIRYHINAKHLLPLSELKLKIIEENKDSLTPEELSVPQVALERKQREEEEKKEQEAKLLSKPSTMEEYAQRLLEMGFNENQMKKVSPSVIINAQKLLIEKEKVKLQNDALQLAMIKMMSGLIGEEDVPNQSLLTSTNE